MSTHPTGPEIDLLVSAFLGNCGPQATQVYNYTRAVLALWGSPPPKGERVYAFRRKGLADFCTCDEARYEELSNKPNLFEMRIFYTAPQPSPAAQGDAQDAARLDWLALAGPTSICVVIDRPYDGEVEVSTDDVTGYGKTLREALDAARKQGGAT